MKVKKRTPEQFITDLYPGVDWGPTPFEVVWKSPYFALLRKRGHKYWGGRGSPQRYARTEYLLVDLRKGLKLTGISLHSEAVVKRHEGRLSVTKKCEMIFLATGLLATG